MRVASGFFAALFALGAAVQTNDPDPALWILAYAVGAALSLAAALGRGRRGPAAVASAVYLVGFATLAPSLLGAPGEAFRSFEMQAASHEEPREAIGLALLAGWTAVLAWRARGQPAARPSPRS